MHHKEHNDFDLTLFKRTKYQNVQRSKTMDSIKYRNKQNYKLLQSIYK